MSPKFSLKRRAALIRGIIVRLAVLAILYWLLVFLPAGTLKYRQAWVYLAVLALPMAIVVAYLLKHDPGLLERRFRHREKEETQMALVVITTALFAAGFLVPALDFRFGWSTVPAWTVVAADCVVLISYGFVFLVFRENSYASRVVEVAKGQKVISTGPYAVIRHPMYLGILFMYLATPLALGSWWGVLPMLSIPATLVVRLRHEEKVLLRELPSYAAYRRRVRYRLIPGLW